MMSENVSRGSDVENEGKSKKQKVSDGSSTDTPPRPSKSVYLCGGRWSEYSSWYRLLDPLGGLPERGTKLVPLPSAQSSFTCIACDSKIYAFGGTEGDTLDATKSIFVFDPKLVQDSIVWTKLPTRMDTPRFFPVLAVHDDLIYIFGTHTFMYTPPVNPWAEVYDPKSGQIDPLSNPPRRLSEARNYSWPAVYKNKIYISNAAEMFVYDINFNSWDQCVLLPDRPVFPIFISGNVVHDGILFTMDDSRVAAYDFSYKKLTFPVPGFEEVLDPFDAAHPFLSQTILDLGAGKFCLAFVTDLLWSASPTFLFVAPFEVITEFKDGSRFVSANIISVALYPLSGHDFYASAAV